MLLFVGAVFFDAGLLLLLPELFFEAEVVPFLAGVLLFEVLPDDRLEVADDLLPALVAVEVVLLPDVLP